MGTQFNQAFESRAGRPSPLFLGLIMAAAGLSLAEFSVQKMRNLIAVHDPWAN